MNMRCCYSQFEMPWDLFFLFLFVSCFIFSSSSTFMPFIITRVSHEKTTNTKMKPFSFLFRQYWHSQTNQPKKRTNEQSLFWPLLLLPFFCFFVGLLLFHTFYRVRHQDETNTFSMILLMHSIIFRINAVKYEVCNKKFL